MKKMLSDIADISSGLVVSRKKASVGAEETYKYMQLNLRSLNKNCYFDLDEAETLYSVEELSAEYLTKEKDIVMRMTEPFTAVYVSKEYENIVVSSNFCIIRNTKINPEFLCYYLNSDIVKRRLFNNLQGNLIKSISMVPIKNLEVPILDDLIQQKYAALFSAETKKIQTLNSLIKLEEKRLRIVMEKLSEE